MLSGASGWVLKQAAQQVWQRSMEKAEEKKKPLPIGINENSFENDTLGIMQLFTLLFLNEKKD